MKDTLERFANNQRVRVIAPDDNNAPLKGKTGTVARIKISGMSAWVGMDEPIPEDLASFGIGDRRRNHVCLFPDECSAAE